MVFIYILYNTYRSSAIEQTKIRFIFKFAHQASIVHMHVCIWSTRVVELKPESPLFLFIFCNPQNRCVYQWGWNITNQLVNSYENIHPLPTPREQGKTTLTKKQKVHEEIEHSRIRAATSHENNITKKSTATRARAQLQYSIIDRTIIAHLTIRTTSWRMHMFNFHC